MLIKMLREMRIKDVCFVNCDFALFISIHIIIVIINMIRDNQIYMISLDCTRVKRPKNFGGLSRGSSLCGQGSC
jgi:hypothetical protein